MSFGEYSSRGPAAGNYSRNGNSEFTRLSNCVGNNIQQINNNVSRIQRLTDKVGTAEDVTKQLQQYEHETQKLAKETNSFLKQLNMLLDSDSPSERRQRKVQIDKLTNNFSSSLNNFQKIQRVAAEKEREYVSRARAASMGMSQTPVGGYRGEETLIDFDKTGGGGEGVQVQAEQEIDLELIEERERAIRQLESDIVGVNEIFRDLANMVHEQGDVIDSIEANVESTAVHVETANVQLEKARDYQKASRKKMCCILVIVVVVAGAIGLIIWLSTK